jgi:hypothetical protein
MAAIQNSDAACRKWNYSYPLAAHFPMKAILALALIGIIAFCAYHYHQDNLTAATEEAASEARQKALAEAAQAARNKPKPAPAPEQKPAPPPITPVALSRTIEPMYTSLMAEIDPAYPVDYVPQMEITKERILDKQSTVEAEKKGAYDAASALLIGMIAAAEERTKISIAVVKTQAAKPTALDSSSASGTNRAFFVQGVVNRWTDERARRKPALDAQFSKLRQIERDWNQKASPTENPDTYDLPEMVPLVITQQNTSETNNPLNRPAVSGSQSVFPWRDSYYGRYRRIR